METYISNMNSLFRPNIFTMHSLVLLLSGKTMLENKRIHNRTAYIARPTCRSIAMLTDPGSVDGSHATNKIANIQCKTPLRFDFQNIAF